MLELFTTLNGPHVRTRFNQGGGPTHPNYLTCWVLIFHCFTCKDG